MGRQIERYAGNRAYGELEEGLSRVLISFYSFTVTRELYASANLRQILGRKAIRRAPDDESLAYDETLPKSSVILAIVDPMRGAVICFNRMKSELLRSRENAEEPIANLHGYGGLICRLQRLAGDDMKARRSNGVFMSERRGKTVIPHLNMIVFAKIKNAFCRNRSNGNGTVIRHIKRR